MSSEQQSLASTIQTAAELQQQQEYTEESPKQYIGQREKRREDLGFLLGRSKYISDVRLRDMLFVGFVRSPYAHAFISKIDLSKLKVHPNFVYAMTSEEVLSSFQVPIFQFAFQPGMKNYTEYCLANRKVKYMGEPVVAIVSNDPYAIEDLIELVDVKYDPLPVVCDSEEALLPDAPLIHDDYWTDNIIWPANPKVFRYGDVKEAFAEADEIIEEKFVLSRVHQAPMETRAIVADYDCSTQFMTVWASTQANAILRSNISIQLGIPETRIRVIAKFMGGGFGMKLGYPDEIVVCALSKILEKPMKWVETRSEDLQCSAPARDKRFYLKAAFKKDGQLLGIKVRVVYNSGAYSTLAGVDPALWAMRHVTGCYRMKAFEGEAICVCTNTAPTGAYRGFGMLPGAIAIERIMDVAARRLRLDPYDIRMKNVIKDNSMPFTNIVGMRFDSLSCEQTLSKASEVLGYENWKSSKEKLRDQGRYIGIGFANYIECSAADQRFTIGLPGWEVAKIRLEPLGKIYVSHGGIPHGQGSDTAIAQVVATELGVDIEDVDVESCDTDQSLGLGTWRSRTACASGAASIIAARKLKEKIKAIAAYNLDTTPDNVRIQGKRCYKIDEPDRDVLLENIGSRAYWQPQWLPPDVDPTLEVTATWSPPFIVPPDERDMYNQSPTYANSTVAVVVEIDPETFAVNILDAVVIHDCGVQINPMIVEGQVHGASAQAIGHALFEELIYDRNGSLVDSSFMDYMIPTANDVPNMEIRSLSTPSKTIPGGFKGAGEMMGIAPAIINAVNDAIAPWKAEIKQTPITPNALFKLLTSERRSGASS